MALAGAVTAYLAPLMGMVVFGCLAVGFGQDATWDLKHYHWYNAHAFLNGRLGHDIAAAGVETYHNPLPDVAFYWLNVHLPPVWAGFLLGAANGLCLVAVFGLAFLLFGLHPSLVPARLAAAFMVTLTAAYQPPFLTEIGTSMTDGLTAAPVLFATLLIAQALVGQARPRGDGHDRPARHPVASVAVAGLLLGGAAGLKLTNSYFVPAAALALFAAATRWQRLTLHAAVGVGSVVGVLLTNGFWMFTLNEHFDSPLFPLFNSRFRSPYFPPDDIAFPWFRPATASERWFYPFHWLWTQTRVMEGPFRDARLAALYTLLIATAVAVLDRRSAARRGVRVEPVDHRYRAAVVFVLVFIVSAYVLWQTKLSCYRYAVPLLFLAPVVCVLLIPFLTPFGRLLPMALSATVCAGITAWTVVPYYGRQAWQEPFIQTQFPPFEEADGALLLYTWATPGGPSPITFAFVDLPPSMRIVKLDTPMVEQPCWTNEEVKALIRGHEGAIYFATPPTGEQIGLERVKAFGLAAVGPGHPARANWTGLTVFRLTRRPDVTVP
jgi:hypothetical protein